MSTNLLWQGLELMLVGMGSVFVFLTLLVGATALMSRLVARFEGPVPGAAEGAASEEEIAAIAAAIARHRGRSR